MLRQLPFPRCLCFEWNTLQRRKVGHGKALLSRFLSGTILIFSRICASIWSIRHLADGYSSTNVLVQIEGDWFLFLRMSVSSYEGSKGELRMV